MFALSGHWSPALQSFLCKALSSAGFISQKDSLVSPYVLLKGTEAFLVDDVDQEAEPLDSSLLSRWSKLKYNFLSISQGPTNRKCSVS